MLPPLTHWFARAVCATQTNKTTKWAVGCSMVAWAIFTQHHKAVNTIPYQLVFGQPPKVTNLFDI